MGKLGRRVVQDERTEQEQQPLDWKSSHPRTSNARILQHRLQHRKPHPRPSPALVRQGVFPIDFRVHLRGCTYSSENNSQIGIIFTHFTHPLNAKLVPATLVSHLRPEHNFWPQSHHS